MGKVGPRSSRPWRMNQRWTEFFRGIAAIRDKTAIGDVREKNLGFPFTAYLVQLSILGAALSRDAHALEQIVEMWRPDP